MKQLFCIVTLLLCLPMTAQNLGKFYKQALHSEGSLYFVLPQEMSELKIGKEQCCKPLSYDYTYLDARDSVTLLMTTVTKSLFKADSLSISFYVGEQRSYVTELIYCKSVKRGWECRIHCVLPYNDWKLMYQGAEPFTFTLFSKENNSRLSFSNKSGKWSEISTKFVRLQDIIRLNRKK